MNAVHVDGGGDDVLVDAELEGEEGSSPEFTVERELLAVRRSERFRIELSQSQ